MPTYSYKCECGTIKDEIRNYSDRDQIKTCPDCLGDMTRIPTACNLGGMDNVGRSKSGRNEST